LATSKDPRVEMDDIISSTATGHLYYFPLSKSVIVGRKVFFIFSSFFHTCSIFKSKLLSD